MFIPISADDPVQAVIDQENATEIRRWSEQLLRAGTGIRSYTEQKKVVRDLIRWGEEEPETRREVVKGVVRENRNRMDFFVHLQVIACEVRR